MYEVAFESYVDLAGEPYEVPVDVVAVGTVTSHWAPDDSQSRQSYAHVSSVYVFRGDKDVTEYVEEKDLRRLRELAEEELAQTYGDAPEL